MYVLGLDHPNSVINIMKSLMAIIVVLAVCFAICYH